MKPDELFDKKLEASLRRWMLEFSNVDLLFDALPRLFAKLDEQHVAGTIEDGASLVGPVHLGKASIVRSGTIIVGPAIIGERVIVDSAVEIRDYVYVGSDSRIFHGASVEQSLILNGSLIGSNAYLSNALVGSNSTIGPGALVGVEPLPSDQDSSCSRKPCVSLGARTRVGAGAIIELGCTISPQSVVANGRGILRISAPGLRTATK